MKTLLSLTLSVLLVLCTASFVFFSPPAASDYLQLSFQSLQTEQGEDGEPCYYADLVIKNISTERVEFGGTSESDPHVRRSRKFSPSTTLVEMGERSYSCYKGIPTKLYVLDAQESETVRVQLFGPRPEGIKKPLVSDITGFSYRFTHLRIGEGAEPHYDYFCIKTALLKVQVGG